MRKGPDPLFTTDITSIYSRPVIPYGKFFSALEEGGLCRIAFKIKLGDEISVGFFGPRDA